MASTRPLLSYEDALARVLDHALVRPTVTLPLERLLGHVLGQPIVATHDLPPFSSSAMDGYGLVQDDLDRIARDPESALQVRGQIQAGDDPTDVAVRPGAAIRIFTGAPIPTGVTAVVPQEDADREGDTIRVRSSVKAGQHVRPGGEEFRSGDVIAKAGTVVTPGVVAAIGAAGFASAAAVQPHVAGLLVTGEELVPPGEPLRPGSIHDSNSFGIRAALEAMGTTVRVVRVGDDAAATERALAELMDTCSLVFTSGGVSVGDYDVVRPALDRLNVETVFWGVAIKPGKPILFGLRGRAHDRTAVFGLPGNPVSVMVTLFALGRPYILSCLGLDGRPRFDRVVLCSDLRKKPGRLEFVPCRVRDGHAYPSVSRGSHMIGTLVGANALVLFPREADRLEAGAEAEVLMMDWRLS